MKEKYSRMVLAVLTWMVFVSLFADTGLLMFVIRYINRFCKA